MVSSPGDATVANHMLRMCPGSQFTLYKIENFYPRRMNESALKRNEFTGSENTWNKAEFLITKWQESILKSLIR